MAATLPAARRLKWWPLFTPPGALCSKATGMTAQQPTAGLLLANQHQAGRLPHCNMASFVQPCPAKAAHPRKPKTQTPTYEVCLPQQTAAIAARTAILPAHLLLICHRPSRMLWLPLIMPCTLFAAWRTWFILTLSALRTPPPCSAGLWLSHIHF